MRRAILFVISATLCGCPATHQLYAGPRRPASQIATLRSAEVGQGLSTVQFYANTVDGKSAYHAKDQVQVRGYPTVELLPGTHEIAIGVYGSGALTTTWSTRDCILSLNMQAGHTYVVEGVLRERNWHAWTRDETTNEIFYCRFPGLPVANGSHPEGWRPPCPYGLERVVAVPNLTSLRFEDSAEVRLAGVDPDGGMPNIDADVFNIVGQCVRLQGQRGTMTDPGSVDPGARIGSYVYLGDNSFLNLLLIEGGYATADRTVAHRFREQFEAAEAAARAEHRGRWATASDRGVQ